MKILGYDYRLINEEDHDNAMGRCNFRELFIRIAPNLPKQQTESTLIHEIIEALAYHLQLGFCGDNKIVSTLEAGLYQVLTDAGVDLSPLAKELQNKKR